MNKERLISQELRPNLDAPPAREAAIGEPTLPSRFTWRGNDVEVAEVITHWKDTGPCSHGSGEMYLKKHWFEVRTSEDQIMKIYFERQARSRAARKARWWLYTIRDGDAAE